MRLLQKLIIKFTILSLVLFVPVFATNSLVAADATDAAISSVCQSVNSSGGCDSNSSSAVTSVIKLVLNILSVLIGFIAVIMIIINGLRFITSSGDSGKVKTARNGITYALIGLAVAVLAQVMVHFVLNKVSSVDQPTTTKSAPKKKK